MMRSLALASSAIQSMYCDFLLSNNNISSSSSSDFDLGFGFGFEFDQEDDQSCPGSWKTYLQLSRSAVAGITVIGACTLGGLLLLRRCHRWIGLGHGHHRLVRLSDPGHPTFPGLRNVGNNCFLNAILQALASCGTLLSFLTTYDKESTLSLLHGLQSSYPSLPLTEALSELLKELSVLDSKPHVLSPCRVMVALRPYAKQFDLSSQQDAAEALTHLTGALHEEQRMLLRYCKASKEDTADRPNTSFDKILNTLQVISEGKEDEDDDEMDTSKPLLRWPLEGTIGSMLTCQECGFQFPTQFQSFHDIPLSPPHLDDGNIVDSCDLETCLEQFTAPESIANVKCSYCSHVLALNLLQKKEGVNKAVLQRIENCSFDDDCSCESFITQEGETWKNVYVNALKQMKFGSCPKVICCHVQRANINKYGDVVKWTGHMTFPLSLNFFPYTISAQGYTRQKYLTLANAPVHLMGHEELLQKHIWQKRAFEIEETESNRYHDPSSSDESTSDDTHMSLTSSSEDSTSESSFESTVWSSEDAPEAKFEGYEDLQHEVSGLSTVYDDPHPDKQDNCIPMVTDPDLTSCTNEILSEFKDVPGSVSSSPICLKPSSETEMDSSNLVSSTDDGKCLEKKPYAIAHNPKKSRRLYELVSVVVHDGSPGNGHYTVYRRAKINNKANISQECKDDNRSDQTSVSMDCDVAVNDGISSVNNQQLNINDVKADEMEVEYLSTECSRSDIGCAAKAVSEDDVVVQDSLPYLPESPDSAQTSTDKDESVLWFRISDSHVDLVTEQDVLMAEATLLFYERCYSSPDKS